MAVYVSLYTTSATQYSSPETVIDFRESSNCGEKIDSAFQHLIWYENPFKYEVKHALNKLSITLWKPTEELKRSSIFLIFGVSRRYGEEINFFLYLQKLALTSPTSGGRSVGIVRSRTQTVEFVCLFLRNFLPLLEIEARPLGSLARAWWYTELPRHCICNPVEKSCFTRFLQFCSIHYTPLNFTYSSEQMLRLKSWKESQNSILFLKVISCKIFLLMFYTLWSEFACVENMCA
jgi:hypothetical protein